MGQFTFWRNVGALALMGTVTYAEDQMVRDRNGDPWVISIRPGSRLAGLPLPGVTRSVPAPSEPLPPSFSVPPRTTEVRLPEPPPPAPGRRAVPTTTIVPVVLPTVAADAPISVAPPAPAPAPASPVAPLPAPAPPAASPPQADKVPTPAQPAPAPPADLKLPTPELPGRAFAAPALEGGNPIIIPGHTSVCAPRVNGRTYEEVYRSVPYSYVEYLANPSYRHEATMEILFGELRPTTVHKEYTPQLVHDPLADTTPYRPFLFAHPEQWIYRYTDYRYQWYLAPQLTAPYGMF